MKKKELTASEQELMKAVWEIEEEGGVPTTRTVRKKVDEWRAERITSQSVYVQMGNLQQKGYIEIKKDEKEDRVYTSIVKKEDYVKRQAKYWAGFLNKTVPGYVMMAIGKNISKEERDELRRYLDELD